jgi:Mycoplasma protein of unknown function, DUF285
VTQVTNFAQVFQDAKTFNEPLTMWNTTSATKMDSMFLRANVFNQPLVRSECALEALSGCAAGGFALTSLRVLSSMTR